MGPSGAKEPGNWYVAYGQADLNDGQFQGGCLEEMAAGLNWFLSPNLKFQWNYTYNYRHDATGRPDGVVHGFGTRLAFDF